MAEDVRHRRGRRRPLEPTVRARLRRAGGRSVVLWLAAVAALSLLTVSSSAGAAFTATTRPPAASLASDLLDAPAALTASRPCLSPSPTFRSASTVGGQVSTLSVPRPSGTAAGDVLLAFVQHHDSTSPPQPPAGWTVLHRNPTGSGESLLAGRVATASEPATYAFSGLDPSDTTAATVLAYTGASPTTPWEATDVQTVRAATVTAPSVQPATARTRWVTGFLVDDHTGAVSTPTGTVRAALTVPGPQYSQLVVSDREHSTLSATGTSSVTLTASADASGLSVLLRSAVVAPAVTLSWSPTPDGYAAGYEVTRTGSSATTTVSGRLTTSLLVEDLPAASSAVFSVRSTAGTWRSAVQSVAVAAC
ncbi:hypothetical protein [Aquipuribacter sp. SD81]|uniref:hypothetical protein n=1 Tax=Aquipuribacter sp. SD81 TaxID=3127703 RepID=UPI00301589B6